jgi:glucose-6-phosphate isomerase
MSHRDIHIDFNNAIDPQQVSGVSDEALAAVGAAWLEVHRGLHAMHEMGQVQFMNLPYLETSLQDLEERAETLRQKFDVMVVLGIGGSGLGAKAIHEACYGPFLAGAKLPGPKGLYVLDTLDPDYLSRFFDHLEPARTVFNIVSKSGNTVETMAQFMIIHDYLEKKLGGHRFRQHIVMTTDAKEGTLRKVCQEEGFESFDILPGVGGRFSILSPVGLLPAAFLGIPIGELAEGAVHMDKRCRLADLWTNPAAMLAAVIYLLSEQQSRKQLVVFNYSERLMRAVEWYSQLFAESLGKKLNLQGEEIRAGITPISASGPRDQHSQMQLYVEGPKDKMVMFWQQEKFDMDIKVPPIYPEKENLNYLGGKKISDILYAEILATEQALREAGVPSFKLSIFGSDPYTLGQLFFLMEIATVYLGGLFNVNPYNQPGVEQGKKYLYGKLGREGFADFGGVLARRLKEKRYVV